MMDRDTHNRLIVNLKGLPPTQFASYTGPPRDRRMTQRHGYMTFIGTFGVIFEQEKGDSYYEDYRMLVVENGVSLDTPQPRGKLRRLYKSIDKKVRKSRDQMAQAQQDSMLRRLRGFI